MEELVLKGLDEVVYYYKTKCGLPIYMWVNENIKSMFMTLSVMYGSVDTKFKVGNKIYEVPDGTAHFLEHIKFNMDDDKTAHDEFYKIGGDANAFTTFDYTSYIAFATKNKKENLNLLLDFVYNPYFTKSKVNKEKGIIIEETNMGLDDPYTECFFKSMEDVFHKSKYRRLITGMEKDINDITLEDVKLVYDNFYHPNNMFLCLTGNFNPYEMAQVVDENLSKKEFLEYSNPQVIKENETKKVNNYYHEHYVNVSYTRMKFQIKLRVDALKEYGILKSKMLINLILNSNFGATSNLKDELVEKGLITSIYTGVEQYDDYFIISINVSTNYVLEIKKRIMDALNNLSVSESDFIRKKNSEIATIILNYEDVENVNMRLQDDIINHGGIVTNIKEILENLSLDEVDDVINKIDVSNTSISVFLPKENQES